MLDSAATLVRSQEMIATEVDGEIVLISLDDGRYYGLDSVASEIWRRLESPKRADALCDELQTHFAGDPDTISRETMEFLAKMAEQRLIAAQG